LGPLFDYDTLTFANNLSFNGGCYLQIDSLRLPPNGIVRAGTYDTVVVRGKGFGNSQGTGNIFLSDANVGFEKHYMGLDPTDVKDWSDSLVRFVVPGKVDSLIAPNTLFGIPGSGFLKLTNNAGDNVTGDWLNIFYAISTEIQTAGKLDFIPIDVSLNQQGGIRFQFDTTFTNYPKIMECANKAIKDWVCLTNMHFESGDTLPQPLPTPNISDSVSTMTFGTLPIGTLANTYTHTFNGPCPHVLYGETDVIVNKLYRDSLQADTARCDSLAFLKYDLYAILLHELGHAHGLNHINDTDNVMYYARKKGASPFTPPQERQIWIDIDASSDSGGHYEMNRATDPAFSACIGNFHLIQPIYLTDCGRSRLILTRADCHPSAIFDIQDRANAIELFPNPVSSVLNLAFQEEKPVDINIEIYDYVGRQIQKPLKYKSNEGQNHIVLQLEGLNNG
jgi:hypothetical protein